MTAFIADYPDAVVVPSPNHGERIECAAPDTIILHYTGMPSEEAALSWLCTVESQVSSHYLVRENGEVVQMVPESRRAWHAGKSFWAGATDINSRSIGIEIANAGHPSLPDYPEKQVEAVAQLCLDCASRWSIAPERVLAHSDIAPVRKVDPGEHFPWGRLHALGVGHWVEPTAITGGRFFQRGDRGQPVEALQSMLSLYGYPVEINGDFDAVTEGVVRSFQLHFRPSKVDGVADYSTIDTLHRLLAALPRFS
ncbi:N-acetylmuramoyl-L-alanine amidase [Agrobacterium vitis]|uniref:N-acetylmuramoyl-L-alanine amidase n=1 Tax=Allorhizobium ampelinum TaxID=3025782 RepID=UPI001F388F7C|nr:N-acetylmuramoyl-L-alanine amidase [Allorhizobium ampelinum]MCF1461278.1 N-acetylmuramoyl-L-alanine amidase [Allorhizobium ampelinum]